MNVFVPYKSPLECAKALYGDRRFNKQIIECKQILDAIDGVGKGWFNHPVINMYKDHRLWLKYYEICLMYYREYKNGSKECLEESQKFSHYADKIMPYFLTNDFCNQHKRRLFTKAPDLYPQFAEYGTSEENWYFVDGELLKYKDGKRIK